MKKLLLAVVLPLAATSVYAETSVTLYGGADGGITVQKLNGRSRQRKQCFLQTGTRLRPVKRKRRRQ